MVPLANKWFSRIGMKTWQKSSTAQNNSTKLSIGLLLGFDLFWQTQVYPVGVPYPELTLITVNIESGIEFLGIRLANL
jgi:hypothetical protein